MTIRACALALERLLRSLGHSASTFDSAEDFLKSEKLHDTSCLITDVQMPDLTGIELQDHLLAEGLRIPIIFMTAYSDENILARAMRVGAVGF
jgi:FixJ family two-component response regulator